MTPIHDKIRMFSLLFAIIPHVFRVIREMVFHRTWDMAMRDHTHAEWAPQSYPRPNKLLIVFYKYPRYAIGLIMAVQHHITPIFDSVHVCMTSRMLFFSELHLSLYYRAQNAIHAPIRREIYIWYTDNDNTSDISHEIVIYTTHLDTSSNNVASKQRSDKIINIGRTNKALSSVKW